GRFGLGRRSVGGLRYRWRLGRARRNGLGRRRIDGRANGVVTWTNLAGWLRGRDRGRNPRTGGGALAVAVWERFGAAGLASVPREVGRGRVFVTVQMLASGQRAGAHQRRSCPEPC